MNEGELFRIAGGVAESERRKTEALRLFRPMPSQMQFFLSAASERIVRGGNRSGKSTAAFVEVASAATGTPLTSSDGKPMPFRYPVNRPLLIWLIGYDERHIGGTIYRMLFLPGAFRVIRDERTGEWRSWDPRLEYDRAYPEKAEEAPPLIPPRLIDPKGWAWGGGKSERVFSICRLRTGTELHAFSSKGAPKQGDPVDLIHIDEDIEYSNHVAEWQARLSDRKGRLIWSVWPHSRNNALVRMSKRAEQEQSKDHPDVHEIVLKFSDNPYIDEDEKRKRIAAWEAASPEERRSRDLGEFITDTVLVYPSFSPRVHGVPRDVGDYEDEVDEILRERGGQIPNDWARFLSLDPGHSVCAVLFGAVPPPDVGDALVIYDEIYAQRKDANDIARMVRDKCTGVMFEAFVIDHRAGRQTPMGFNRTVKQQYAQAFARYGVECRMLGANFLSGSDNVDAGVGLVRNLLSIIDSRPTLRVVAKACPHMLMEFDLYKKKIVRDETKDEPVDRDCHTLDALRYLASIHPEWRPPQPTKKSMSPAYSEWLDWSGRRPEESECMVMGPGAVF